MPSLPWLVPIVKPHVTPSAPSLWHSLDIRQRQVLVGEVEELGPLGAVASPLSVYLAHSGCPLSDISPVFIRKPKDLWFGRMDLTPGKAWGSGGRAQSRQV